MDEETSCYTRVGKTGKLGLNFKVLKLQGKSKEEVLKNIPNKPGLFYRSTSFWVEWYSEAILQSSGCTLSDNLYQDISSQYKSWSRFSEDKEYKRLHYYPFTSEEQERKIKKIKEEESTKT